MNELDPIQICGDQTIIAVQECATTTNWSINTSSSIEEAWSLFKGTLSLVPFPFILRLVSRRPYNFPSWINKKIKKLLRRRAQHWNIIISTCSEHYRSTYCKTGKVCKELIIKTRFSDEKQWVRDCESGLKRLFSYIKRLAQRTDKFLPLPILQSPLILVRNNVANTEYLSECFSKVFSTDYDERSTVNYNNGGMSTNPLLIKKGTVLRLLHISNQISPDDIHPRIVKALETVIAEPLAILFDMSLRHCKLPRD